MLKVAVITSYKEPLQIKQVSIPQVASNDVLVKLIACGVCHSDLHTAKAGEMKNISFLEQFSVFDTVDFTSFIPYIWS
jgi:D-arabinose 1-dehydrogenase-like Zn-dependent alcohol dehydrogenase